MPARHFVLDPRYRNYVTGIGQTCNAMTAVSRPGNKTIARPLTCTRWTVFWRLDHIRFCADSLPSGSHGVGSCEVGPCSSGRVSSSPNKPEKRSRSTCSDFRQAGGTSRAPAARSSSTDIKCWSSTDLLQECRLAGSSSTSNARPCRISFSRRFSPITRPPARDGHRRMCAQAAERRGFGDLISEMRKSDCGRRTHWVRPVGTGDHSRKPTIFDLSRQCILAHRSM